MVIEPCSLGEIDQHFRGHPDDGGSMSLKHWSASMILHDTEGCHLYLVKKQGWYQLSCGLAIFILGNTLLIHI
jgi:hypothetical protein